jgi:aminopeptidase N
MSSVRYCKCHFHNGESEHWGILDRKAFAQKGANAHFAPDTPLLPKHLLLELRFDWEEERVWGNTRYDIKVNAHDVQEIVFDAVNLEIEKVMLGRRSLEFENTGDRVIVSLDKALKYGRIVQVTIFHSVVRPPAGIYFTKPDKAYPDRFKTVWTQGQDEDSKYYFPCFDQPNFKQTTEVKLHLPKGMFGLSNGRLIKKSGNNKESFYHYKLEIPYSTYLLSIVAGEFSAHESRVGGVDIKWYVQKGRDREGLNAFKDTGKIIRFFSDYIGYPYPYKHYTQIAVPEFVFGGMENFTVTTQTDLTLHDDRARLDMDSNGLVAHEAAHMWFGDVVTVRTWSHAWLHESFATYFDALYTRESKGEDEFRYQLLEDAETYFSEDVRYRRPIVTHIYKEPIDLFDAHLYPGGAVRLHYLKSIVGEPLFRKTLALFLKRHEYGLVETVDLLRCLEEVSGKNFDEWMDQWIYRGGYPIMEAGYQWSAVSNMAEVTLKQTQKGEKKGEELLFKLPLQVEFYTSRGSEKFPLEIKNKEEKFCFHLKSKPLYFRLDPDYECPAKKVRLEVSRSLLHEQLKRDKDPIGRIEAAQSMVAKASQADIKILSQCLKKETQWGVAHRIAKSLGKIGGESARDGLLRSLNIRDAKIRLGIVQALGEFMGDEKVARALKKIAQGDPSYRVEAEALYSLGRIKAKNCRSFLESFLDRPSHNDMGRAAIFRALANLEEEGAWATLLQGADYGAPRGSRFSAVQGLAKLAGRFEHLKPEAINVLKRFARETRGTPSATFRGKLAAIHAMGELEDLSAIPTLRRVAEGETDGRLKRRAEETVARLFESAKKPKEMQLIRSDLDDLMRENKSLRDRVDVMENKKDAKQKSKKNKG